MKTSPLLVGTATELERATRMGIARIVIGSSVLLTTGLARRIFAIPAEQDNAAVRLTARLFGARNVVLGLWALSIRTEPAESRRRCYQLNAAVDAADVAILTVAAATGERLSRTALIGSALGGSALVAWLQLSAQVGAEATEGAGGPEAPVGARETEDRGEAGSTPDPS